MLLYVLPSVDRSTLNDFTFTSDVVFHESLTVRLLWAVAEKESNVNGEIMIIRN